MALFIKKCSVVIAYSATIGSSFQGTLKHGFGLLALALALEQNRHGLQSSGIARTPLQSPVKCQHGTWQVVAFKIGHPQLGKRFGWIGGGLPPRLSGAPGQPQRHHHQSDPWHISALRLGKTRHDILMVEPVGPLHHVSCMQNSGSWRYPGGS